MASQDALRRCIAAMLAAVAVISTALAVVADFQDRFMATKVRDAIQGYARMDQQFIAAANGGGLFLRFVDFPPSLDWFPGKYYLRAIYALYPQRVLMSRPSATIFTREQLLAANFEPDAAWLLGHHVPTELTFTYNSSNSTMTQTVQRVAGPSPPGPPGPPGAR